MLRRIRRIFFRGAERRVAAKLSSVACISDADESLVALKAGGHRLFAFSNGAAEAVEEVLRTSGLRVRFEGVVSCDALETFKPNPDVYRYFMKEAGGSNDAWLIFGNPFDVIGGVLFGIPEACFNRGLLSI